jgi:hypothetical protein
VKTDVKPPVAPTVTRPGRPVITARPNISPPAPVDAAVVVPAPDAAPRDNENNLLRPGQK